MRRLLNTPEGMTSVLNEGDAVYESGIQTLVHSLHCR